MKNAVPSIASAFHRRGSGEGDSGSASICGMLPTVTVDVDTVNIINPEQLAVLGTRDEATHRSDVGRGCYSDGSAEVVDHVHLVDISQ